MGPELSYCFPRPKYVFCFVLLKAKQEKRLSNSKQMQKISYPVS